MPNQYHFVPFDWNHFVLLHLRFLCCLRSLCCLPQWLVLLREIEGPVAKVEGGKDDGEYDPGNNVNPLRPEKYLLRLFNAFQAWPERKLLGKVSARGDPRSSSSPFPTTGTLAGWIGKGNLVSMLIMELWFKENILWKSKISIEKLTSNLPWMWYQLTEFLMIEMENGSPHAGMEAGGGAGRADHDDGSLQRLKHQHSFQFTFHCFNTILNYQRVCHQNFHSALFINTSRIFLNTWESQPG